MPEKEPSPKQDWLSKYLKESGLTEMIEEALATGRFKTLTPRQQEILTERLGLGGDEPKTLREVGLRLGIDQWRVRDIERAAVLKLRRSQLTLVSPGSVLENPRSIELLGLPKPVEKALIRACHQKPGLATIRGLYSYPKQRLRQIRGLGPVAIGQIYDRRRQFLGALLAITALEQPEQ